MKTINFTIILLAILTFASCKKNKEKIAQEVPTEMQHENEIHVTQAQFESAKMALGTISKQAFPNIVKVTGMVDVPPQSKAVITSYYAGNVKTSKLLIGDKVRKGQALVSIANPEFIDMQQEFLEISEQLNYLKTEYQRQKTLFDEQITSQKNYLKAKSDYDRQKARYNGLRKKLQMLNINPNNVSQGNIVSVITLFAPIDGYVTKVNVSKGTYVSPQDIVLEIVNTDHIHIELTAFEKDVMSIKKHQKINFKIPEASSAIFYAEVHLVGTSIDETTRTVKVHGHLNDDIKYNFAVGMFVDAEIETTSKDAMALPEDAVIENGEEFVVLVLNNEDDKYTFEAVPVKIGKKSHGFIEIISDNIKPTDDILIKGGFPLIASGGGGGHSH